MSTLGTPDYAVILLTLGFSTLIGIFYAWRDRNRQTNEEFLMAGKNMGVFPVTISLTASYVSGMALLGIPSEIYMRSTQIMVMGLSNIVGITVAAELFLPIFFRLKVTSVNKYLEARYQSRTLRVIASVSGIFCGIPFLGIVLFGPALALGAVTDFSVNTSIVVMGSICTFYTVIGGLKAVIWADVLQFGVLMLGIVAIVVKGSAEVGGLGKAFNIAGDGGRLQFFNMDFDIYAATFWTLLLGWGLMNSAMFSVSQMQVQRTRSLDSLVKAKLSLYMSLPCFLTLHGFYLLIGITMYAYYSLCDPTLSHQIERPDQMVPYYVLQLLGQYPGLPGLFVACLFSGALSTLSSGFNAFATLAWEDFMKAWFVGVSDRKTIWVTKGLATLIGFASVAFAFLSGRIGTIIEACVGLSGSQLGPMFAIFVMGVFVPIVNANGAIVGLLCGQALCLWISFGAIAVRGPFAILPASTDGCLASNFTDFTAGVAFSTLHDAKLPKYYPEGMNMLYHVSPYILPCFGFALTFVVGVLISLATGCNRNKQIDSHLVNGRFRKLWSILAPTLVSYDDDESDDSKSKLRDDVKMSRL